MSELPTVVTYFAPHRSIIPVTEDKAGLIKWRELQYRRLSLDELEAFTDAPAFAHITGRISGIFTIDIDPAGLEGCRMLGLAKLAQRETPSGGLHIDVELPEGWLIKGTVGKLYPGVDTRGEGGLALIWGQSRKGTYKWLQSFESSPIKFSRLPKVTQNSLHERCRWVPRTLATVDFSRGPVGDYEIRSYLLRALAYAPRNGRNTMGFWLACRLRDGRVRKEDARAVGYEYVSRVWNVNTHGTYENYTQRQFDAALDNAYSS